MSDAMQTFLLGGAVALLALILGAFVALACIGIANSKDEGPDSQ